MNWLMVTVPVTTVKAFGGTTAHPTGTLWPSKRDAEGFDGCDGARDHQNRGSFARALPSFQSGA